MKSITIILMISYICSTLFTKKRKLQENIDEITRKLVKDVDEKINNYDSVSWYYNIDHLKKINSDIIKVLDKIGEKDKEFNLNYLQWLELILERKFSNDNDFNYSLYIIEDGLNELVKSKKIDKLL